MSKQDSLLGVAYPFRITDRVAELRPILVKDWARFAKVVWVLDMPRLQEIFHYTDAPKALDEVIRVAIRDEVIPPMFDDMDQKAYNDLRRIIIEQNDLDFEFMRNKIPVDKDGKKQ
jgi:hypothetical protein